MTVPSPSIIYSLPYSIYERTEAYTLAAPHLSDASSQISLHFQDATQYNGLAQYRDEHANMDSACIAPQLIGIGIASSSQSLDTPFEGPFTGISDPYIPGAHSYAWSDFPLSDRSLEHHAHFGGPTPVCLRLHTLFHDAHALPV